MTKKMTRFLRAGLFALCTPLLGWSVATPAAEFISVGGFSRHFERDLDLNEFNPGLGYEKDIDKDLSWSTGVFKNSLKRASFYALANYALWQPAEGWRLGITGGLASGYHKSPIVPLVAPFVEWRVSKLGIQAYVIPSVKPYVDGAVVMQFKWRID